jgi:hypothetical protein
MPIDVRLRHVCEKMRKRGVVDTHVTWSEESTEEDRKYALLWANYCVLKGHVSRLALDDL